MIYVKKIQMKYIQNLINKHKELADDKYQDLTKNNSIMFISFLIKLTELVSLIFTVSYLFALLCIILCELVEDMILDVNFTILEVAEEYPNNFFTYYTLDSFNNAHIFLKVFYFAFTSLTTVGFGDFHPCS